MKKVQKIGILLSAETSVASAMLIKDIFQRTNSRLPNSPLIVKFVVLEHFESRELSLNWKPTSKKFVPDLLLVPPMSCFCDDLRHSLLGLKTEIDYIRNLNKKGVIVASSCLGAFLLAEAGILNEKTATTHWDYSEFAEKNYPKIKWKTQKIIESDANVVTSGGYLTMVDVVFYLIEKFINQKISLEMSKRLLVDSTRESQAIYMIRKMAAKDQSPFQRKVQSWFDRNYKEKTPLKAMARDLGMSERTLHRHFIEEFSIPPNQWIQSQRVEKANILLEETDLSQEEIVNKIGLSDINSFRKIFLREVGLTPTEYRKRIRRSI